MKYWERRRSHGQYFLAYDIGKSAVRILPNVQCSNVHKFTIVGSKKNKQKLKSNPHRERVCTAVIDARNFDPKNILRDARSDNITLCSVWVAMAKGQVCHARGIS